MWRWIRTLDRILRGEATTLAVLRQGQFDVPVFGLSVVIDVLGLAYGLCMGLFALTQGGSHHGLQIPATMVKVPSLFVLTLLVTFPSLYVFNALVGSRLLLLSMLRLLVAALAVMMAVLASIGPIVAFFSFTTTSYSFMVLLNVLVFAIAGLLGLAFLLQTLHRMTVASLNEAAPAPLPTAGISSNAEILRDIAQAAAEAKDDPGEFEPGEADFGPLDHSSAHVLAPHVKTIFRIWVVVFGLVGAQMAWVLRPFIGHPGQPFAFFRAPYSNFFMAVVHAAKDLAS